MNATIHCDTEIIENLTHQCQVAGFAFLIYCSMVFGAGVGYALLTKWP